ncbi:MAG: hypothetical protein QNJ98_06215 [Planctomycetota bacterium]|nr:hypothetical protein [Planctomycetota bacterium]
MRRTPVLLALLPLLVLAGAGPARAEEEKPPATVAEATALLTTLVDLPRARQRTAMAKRLANRKEVSLATWLRAMKGFGAFEAVPPGPGSEKVEVPLAQGTAELQFTTYVPEGYDPATPAPLLVVHHGAGGDGRNDWRAWKETADALGMLVVCPGDPKARGGYTAGAVERETAWAALRLARRTFNVDENRIYATGVSRGGHLVWDKALRAPDRFAAIAPMIGGPRLTASGGQNNLRYIENLVGVPIRDLQGSLDDPRLLHNLRYAFSKLHRYKARDARMIEFPDLAHSFILGSVPWKEWLGAAKRDPVPERLVRRFAKEGEGRAFYVDVLQATDKVKEIPQIRVDRRWSSMSDERRRIYMADYIEDRTARLEARYKGRGVFELKADDVRRIRMLLTREMIGEGGRVDVKWNKRRIKRTVKPDLQVLLIEFAERFDRTFLPVAEIKVP